MGRIWARERGKMPLREHSENIPVIHGENWGLSHMGKNSNRMGVRSREEHISTLYFFCPCSGVVAPRAMAHLFFYYSWWRDSGGIDACVCVLPILSLHAPSIWNTLGLLGALVRSMRRRAQACGRLLRRLDPCGGGRARQGHGGRCGRSARRRLVARGEIYIYIYIYYIYINIYIIYV